MKKICPECGKEFETKSSRMKYCNGPHYRICATCGKIFEVRRQDLSLARVYCCEECSDRAKSNSLNKSKVYNLVCSECEQPFTSTNPKARICNRNHMRICKWCGKLFAVTKEQILSDIQTCSSECRYALANRSWHNNPNNSEVADKVAHTMMSLYGVRSALESGSEFREKGKQTCLDKYGAESFSKSGYFKPAVEATNLDRYGSEYFTQTDEFKSKYKNTCMTKYGVNNYAKSEEFLGKVMIDPDKISEYCEFKKDPALFISENFCNQKPTLLELSSKLGVRDSSIGYLIAELGLQDMIQYSYSKMEDEVYQFLKQLLSQDTEIIRNTFKVITPYELDIYIPKYNLAIECNPTSTHNSTFSGFGDANKPKSSSYHKMKTDMCNDKGIFLFHIFGYEWTNRREIIKSMLRNILGCNSTKIYARNCIVKKVPYVDAKLFLNVNHRQGASTAKFSYGLYYQNELVSVMTFSNMRKTIGHDSDSDDTVYELVRFCNKLGTSVVGGASKLLARFVKDIDPHEIRSFSDRAHTQGKLYETLGFKYVHTSSPGYMWVNIKTDIAYSRNNAQKQNICKFLKDDNIDLTKSETEIMKEHNYAQVFDSGVILWKWRKDE